MWWNMSRASPLSFLAPKPLSVITQKVPSAMALMPESGRVLVALESADLRRRLAGRRDRAGHRRRHAAGDDLVQAAEHHVGQHLADSVARGHRPRPFHVQHTALRRAN